MSRRSWIAGILAFSLLTGCGGQNEIQTPEKMDKPTSAKAYAQAVWDIESQREIVYAEIAETIDSDILEQIRCDRPNRVNELSREARRAVVEYCNVAEEIVANNQLTVTWFNNMTQQMLEDEEFQELVDGEFLRLQNERESREDS
ncbi:MAG: DUF4168 domain-containing protein [Cyanobacteria bacterium SID2]|nr:DUF4168 domain-containing protein [Cyanobacteria bacterium SID2]MBP0005320.1 DUF4168 domain-containing protein [Cyanobacteria bacterium SBC]